MFLGWLPACGRPPKPTRSVDRGNKAPGGLSPRCCVTKGIHLLVIAGRARLGRVSQPDGVMFGIDFRHAVEFSRSGRAPITGLSAGFLGQPPNLTSPPSLRQLPVFRPVAGGFRAARLGAELRGGARSLRFLAKASTSRTSVRVGTIRTPGQIPDEWRATHSPWLGQHAVERRARMSSHRAPTAGIAPRAPLDASPVPNRVRGTQPAPPRIAA